MARSRCKAVATTPATTPAISTTASRSDARSGAHARTDNDDVTCNHDVTCNPTLAIRVLRLIASAPSDVRNELLDMVQRMYRERDAITAGLSAEPFNLDTGTLAATDLDALHELAQLATMKGGPEC